ncbi:leucyl/phenylalanyl-tRNA--protein transferase [Pimelobacter simplex]|uniref:leucyl/phenylalanyl-tRNA--protein transferase n=1 Tax=Nocardioides simplex TaxID=2045 RepID=UPI0021501516|nr:leucyl/phenylalanyl-tRNA--protein transferase [Pimelobacter simplex]UUW91362.1 leucyl/phenylalanyl-tRNA--protein transferase [Pimelobacter simplex]UUW95190.1 leucyl/phenylalanyl-tRNA--protein transferase [Pimelobacter simplex]
MPVEPPASPWAFPSRADLAALPVLDPGGLDQPDDPGEGTHDPSDLVAIGADLAPGTLLAAYRTGLFPMPEGRSVGWWCPAFRGVLPLDGLRVSRSLRRSVRDFEIRIDTAFDEVVAACADPVRPHGWIDRRIARAYGDLHRLGWAHSVEAWQDDRLVGGLYGVAVGGLFAGESMFHHVTDASKVALVGLVAALSGDADGAAGRRLIDVQWATRHLTGLGVREITRTEYVGRLARLVEVPAASCWTS